MAVRPESSGLRELLRKANPGVILSGRTARHADEERNERLSEFALTRPFASLRATLSQRERVSARVSVLLPLGEGGPERSEGPDEGKEHCGSLAAVSAAHGDGN